jgi:phospholipase/carboxylesterase
LPEHDRPAAERRPEAEHRPRLLELEFPVTAECVDIVRRMTTSRHDDLSLQYVLSVPSNRADTDELPLIVVLHGRGADMNDLADLEPVIDRGYRWVFPNAPQAFSPMPGYSFGFTWFDGWPAERNSFLASREKLLAFLDEVTARYPTPRGKVILGGFSQGGMMSLDVGYRTKVELAGIVVMSGALNEAELPPFRPELPVIVVHGTEDEMIPLLAAHRARRVLEEHGVAPEYHEYPMGHQVSMESLQAVGEFIQRVL